MPFSTAANFQARLCALWMAQLAPPAFERGHGVSRIADEKHPAAAEPVRDTLVWLPRRGRDNLDVDGLTDRRAEHLAAAVGGELLRGLALPGQVGGGQHAEVVAHRQENTFHAVVFDVDGVTVTELWDELSPGPPEVDEDDVDRQRPVSRRRHAKGVADWAVHAVGSNQILSAHSVASTRIPVTNHCGDAGFILLERTELGPIANPVAVSAAVLQQHRLQRALRTVLRGRLGAQAIERREDRVDVEGLPRLRTAERGLGEHA